MNERPRTNEITTICLREDFLTETDKRSTGVYLIPKYHLFGTQAKEEYSEKSRKQVKEKLTLENGRGYLGLIQNPVIAVPFFWQNDAYLIISDGHHRARYVDRELVPVRLIPADLAAKIYNRSTSSNINTEELETDFWQSRNRALETFNNMPNCKFPAPVFFTGNFEDLTKRFDELPNYVCDNNQAVNLLEGVSFDIQREANEIAMNYEKRQKDFFDNMNA